MYVCRGSSGQEPFCLCRALWRTRDSPLTLFNCIVCSSSFTRRSRQKGLSSRSTHGTRVRCFSFHVLPTLPTRGSVIVLRGLHQPTGLISTPFKAPGLLVWNRNHCSEEGCIQVPWRQIASAPGRLDFDATAMSTLSPPFPAKENKSAGVVPTTLSVTCWDFGSGRVFVQGVQYKRARDEFSSKGYNCTITEKPLATTRAGTYRGFHKSLLFFIGNSSAHHNISSNFCFWSVSGLR